MITAMVFKSAFLINKSEVSILSQIITFSDHNVKIDHMVNNLLIIIANSVN